MADLVAQSGDSTRQGWRKTLPAGPVTFGRRPDKSDWAAPWDKQISALHATLHWRDGKLHVQRVVTATNPIFVEGAARDEFALPVGGWFVIGATTFRIVETEAPAAADSVPPNLELTCSRRELARIKYADPDDRIEALAGLPSMIRFSPSDEDLEKKVAEVLLRGIPRADAAAVVWLNLGKLPDEVEVRVRCAEARRGDLAHFHPSRRLLVSAIHQRRQSVMHSWNQQPGGEYTADTSVGWAICAPLPDDPEPGWALYVCGQRREETPAGAAAQDLVAGDLKFAESVADIFGALRQVRDLQRRQTLLERFFSRTVLEALVLKDIDEVLKPRQTDVTVLFCDLRGFSRFAENPEMPLEEICDRVSEALSIMTREIIDKDGVVSDFQGDAAMGFWGWPLDDADQVISAARAALAIRREFVKAAERPGSRLHGFACGIGVAHGPAIAGRLGTYEQFKIGVFGPVVNLASRLEGMTKFFQAPILVDDHTAAALRRQGSPALRCRRVAQVQPFGMTQTLVISELLSSEVEPGALREQDRRDYEAACNHFIAGRWPLARPLLDRLKHDGPSAVLKRIIDQHQSKPPNNWKGVLALESK